MPINITLDEGVLTFPSGQTLPCPQEILALAEAEAPKIFRVQYCACPTNFNVPQQALVEARDRDHAKERMHQRLGSNSMRWDIQCAFECTPNADELAGWGPVIRLQ